MSPSRSVNHLFYSLKAQKISGDSYDIIVIREHWATVWCELSPSLIRA